MDAAAELGRNLVSKHQIQPEYGDEQAARDGTAEPVSRYKILRRERECFVISVKKIYKS